MTLHPSSTELESDLLRNTSFTSSQFDELDMMVSTSSLEVFKQLLKTGDYSDCTLVCEGREFKTHKSVVCSQSPVLKKALDGSFKEGITNVVNIEAFDVNTVECMVNFLYTGDYSVDMFVEEEVTESRVDLGGRKSNLIMNINEGIDGVMSGLAETHLIDLEDPPDLKSVDISAMLRPHICANAIGDFYFLPDLKACASKKIEAILKDTFSVQGLAEVIRVASEVNHDDPMKHLVIDAIVKNIHEVMEDETLNRSELDAFPLDLIKSLYQRLQATETELRRYKKEYRAFLSTQEDLVKLRADHQHFETQLTTALTHLRTTRQCRNRFALFFVALSEVQM
ncbi:hypothetical protein EJ05DRAFT_495747 [Pseudovirgaria hyperparasitica]|uniref:BTB domain-containing protein n=1 Tax=Pseudovirgaria hyperparasitica TaxID=470096 RepID=A0A6A6WL41_9PEZI|nr:uncharacterized protein EJ05DRAFT_495747 [Pseudovirgaria hyperparasitica]KAF2762896.1 hypothetical protein EJ05DRAFT_495747 [Pseudovirgaria hyperparasitica]